MVLAFPAAGEAQPAPVDLGTLGGSGSVAVAVNDHGQAVGVSNLALDAVFHAFSWTAAGGMVDLTPGLSDTWSRAIALNNRGQVVGHVYLGHVKYEQSRAFLWTAATGMMDLGTLGGLLSSVTDINDHGQVVGASNLPDDTAEHAFLWTAAGGMVDLGTLGGSTSNAVAINESRQVVGNSTVAGDAATHAFLWTAAAGMVDLGTLGGSFSYASAVNEHGQIVGQSAVVGDTATHAFSWTAAGGMVDLGTLGGSFSQAAAVNRGGQTVGSSDLPGNVDHHAFAWTAAGGIVDLDTIGGHLSFAHAVSDTGQVVGDSYLTMSDTHAFSWTAAGGTVDLNVSGQRSFARALNAKGLVAGSSSFPDSEGWTRAALWNTGRYNFRFSGVKQPPAFNEVVAGRPVAVTFSLGGNFGVEIFEGSPTFEQVACGASASAAPISPTGGPPSGSLIYKPEVDRYAWATKTDRNWAGTCRQLNLRLNDGTDHFVNFSFR
jgi:probable HAF family extracellular repeat protein